MFWKYDDEEEKVVPREPEPHLSEDEVRKISKDAIQQAIDAKEKAALQTMDLNSLKTLDEEDDFQSSDETGAEKRFDARVQVFEKENKPVYRHHFWWFVHNCVAHPAIGVYPCKKTFDFHDWTSKKINAK